jgi:hypothetical protein
MRKVILGWLYIFQEGYLVDGDTFHCRLSHRIFGKNFNVINYQLK